MSDLHRATEQQVPEVLTLLAASGGTARTAESWQQDRMTTLVLGGKGGSPIQAAMPMSRRNLVVAPGRMAAVGWLTSNQFASRMSLRRQTRETGEQWADLLPELDALVVVRRDEASLAARWYAHTGFEEVLSIRCLYLDMETAPGDEARGSGAGRYGVEVISAGDSGQWGEDMVAVYRDVYGACGGAVARGKDFWGPALAHHYYRQHYQFQIVGLWSGAGEGAGSARTLMGYAVIGWSGWHSKRPRMDILELATRQWDTGAASELLRATCQLAWTKKVHQVRAVISVHDPYRGHLARSGFRDRWGYLMLAKWLRPQRYLDGLAAKAAPEGGPLSVHLTSAEAFPLRFVVGAAMGAKSLQLQADRRTITRLLFQRLDVHGALRGGAEGTLFSAEGDVGVAEETRLSMAFPWTPWVFHMLDFI